MCIRDRNTAFHISDISGQDTSHALPDQIRVSDRVRVVKGARDVEGRALAAFVYQQIYEVMEIAGDRVVIGQNGTVTAALHMRDLRVSLGNPFTFLRKILIIITR